MPEIGSSSQAPLLSSASSNSASEDESDDSRLNVAYGSTTSRDGNPRCTRRGSRSNGDHYDEHDDEDENGHDEPAQGGVRQADAINQVWSRTALITAYILYADYVDL
jgi:hypothetical protein